jgi:hypothetical protein
MPELLDRRKQDLEQQFETLPGELKHWQELSEKPEYEKHHSQIAVLSRQMVALNNKVRDAWNGSGDFVAIQKAQRDCAAVHTIWNFFREKLLVRSDSHLGSYLRAADAYVWACYEPVLVDRRAADPKRPFREPPLVTFDTELSAWALSREQPFEPEGDKTGATRAGVFVKALNAMPIAVLGIPWYTSELLPNLAILAHETGHVVDADFDLEKPLENALRAALPASALCEGWSVHWRKEVFADLFACYAAGPAFVWTLADSIPDSPEKVKTRRRPSGAEWGPYPPATLRILLNLCALRQLGYAGDADTIEQYWAGDYPEHAMSEYEADLKPVVQAVYAAAKLPGSLDYARPERAKEERGAYRRAVELDSDLDLNERYNPRSLVGAASAVHRRSPAGVDKLVVWGRLQDHMVRARPPGVLAEQQQRVAPGAATPLRTEELTELLFRTGPAEDLNA